MRHVLIIAASTLTAGPAAAYPWLIRHGYQNCAVCHIDPAGGSQLTAYGRATGDLITRMRYSDEQPTEPGPSSKFLFGLVSLPEELLMGGDLRTVGLVRSTGNGQPVTARYFPMQLDVTGGLTFSRVRASASIGFARGTGARQALVVGNDSAQLVSRHHWLGVVLDEDEKWMMRIGRMNQPFGLRIPEHTMWIRDATSTTINDDQQHGVALSYAGDMLRAEVMGIAGNLQIAPWSFRERGYSGFLEWFVGSRAGVGLSSTITHVDTEIGTGSPRWRHVHGLFGRWAPTEAVTVMAEADVVSLTRRDRTGSVDSVAAVMIDTEPFRGLHAGVAGESRCDLAWGNGCGYGGWLTGQWCFAPHADMRVDGVLRKTAQATALESTVMVQLHVYL